MQSIGALTHADFKAKAKRPVSKLEVYIDPAWINICDLSGENYLISANYSKGQRQQTYKPIAATFSAVIDNIDGLFHPQNNDSAYKDYFKVGRKIKFSTGFTKNSTDYLWQWFIGVISDVDVDNANRQVMIQGFDYMQYLSEVKMKSPDNYWGEIETTVTVDGQAEYPMPGACNGVYIAYLDGDPIYEGKHWVYDRANNDFVFLPDYVPAADDIELLIYYFTDQVVENVVADILVSAGLYANQAAALAAMDYTATGVTLERVWFSSGLNYLTAIQKLCERVDYRFHFGYDATPIFKPIAASAGWLNREFLFTKNLIAEPKYFENIDEVKNSIRIEGEKYQTEDELFRIRSGDDQLDKSTKERHLDDGIITSVKIGGEYKIVEILDALPGAGTQGRLVYLTTDKKIYRDNGVAWTQMILPAEVTAHIGGDGVATIGGGKIDDGAITEGKIGGEAVTVGKIGPLAVTDPKIASDSIKDRHVKEMVLDFPYETQGLVSSERDMIVPFYLPAAMLALDYVYLNLYFPGLQNGDYPNNVPSILLSHPYWSSGEVEAIDGVVGSIAEQADTRAGNGVLGGSYLWYRFFLQFDIAPYIGFKLTSCALHYVLNSIAKAGAGANTQISLVLHGTDDFEYLLGNDWAIATDNDFGVINVHDDPVGAEYSKDVKVWLQSLLDAEEARACFRFKGQTEHTDVVNANWYHTTNHQLHMVLEEDTAANVTLYRDNGAGYGAAINTYNSDTENIDLSAQFSGAGKKLLKFTCPKVRRIDVLIRIGVTINRP